MKAERNKVMNRIKAEVRRLEDEKMDKELESLESYKDDSNKYYQAMRNLKSRKKKKHQFYRNNTEMIRQMLHTLSTL